MMMHKNESWEYKDKTMSKLDTMFITEYKLSESRRNSSLYKHTR